MYTVLCKLMQTAAGWIIAAVLVIGIWRVCRAIKRIARTTQQARSEAFASAVSDAVASGVAQALSAAVADAHAAATGGNVAVHIGDNLARLLANDHDDSVRPIANGRSVLDGGPANVGSLSDTARHGAPTGGFPVRGSTPSPADSRRTRRQILPDSRLT